MNYHDIKFFHIFMGLLYVYGLMNYTHNPQGKFSKLVFTFFSALLIASGVASAARLGFSGTELPLWLWAKSAMALVIWLVPFVWYKKISHTHTIKVSSFLMVLLTLAASYLGVFKP